MAKSKNLNRALVPSKAAMIVSLLAWFALARANVVEFAVGLAWYVTAHNDCHRLLARVAHFNGVKGAVVDFHVVCQVVAAISPGKEWSANIADAQTVIEAFFACDTEWDRKAFCLVDGHFQVGYTWKNSVKAWRILAGGGDIEPTSEKTYCFADNLEFPLTSLRATIDQHMIHVLCETRWKGSIGAGGYYGQLEEAVVEAAAILRIRPSELQATIWHERVTRFAAGYSVESIYELVESIAIVEEA